MTIQEFEQLSYDASLQVVNRGVSIAERQKGKYTIFLYRVHNLYVEVYYLSKYSHIYGFRAYEDATVLTAYQNMVDAR